MKIRRTLPPAAAPIYLKDLLQGLIGIMFNKKCIKRLEGEIQQYFDVKHVFLVSSGKAALTLILNALGSLSPGRQKVVIPAYTCFSVPSAIVKAGLKILPCDIDASTLDFNYKFLEEALEKDTLCVVVNHLFGMPSDIERVNGLCKDKGVFVVEDAAQAMGERYKGKPLGTLSDVGFFSLGRGKNITCGSGGIIVTNSDIIAKEIQRAYSRLKTPSMLETLQEFLKAVGLGSLIRPTLYWLPSGLPFLKLGETFFHKDFPIKTLSGMKAGLLKDWQKKLEDSNKMRAENASYFCKRLGFATVSGRCRSYPRLPIILIDGETRDKIYWSSFNQGLGISRMYPFPVNKIQEIGDQFNGMEFPAARGIAERLLTLPTHPLLAPKDREAICSLWEKGLGLAAAGAGWVPRRSEI